MIQGKKFRGERMRSRLFFNLIAFLYPLIEKQLEPRYAAALAQLSLPGTMTVLDIATGTGILAAAFARRGHPVTGLDVSRRLLKRAQKRFPHIHFETFDLAFLSAMESRRFDIVAAGFFLHGISAAFRKEVLQNMARMAARYVLIFDYTDSDSRFVRLIEWFEGPHYKKYATVSRSSEFAEAGLEIQRSLPCAGFCRVWLCRPRRGGFTGEEKIDSAG